MPLVELTARVSGDVHGVGYRYFCKQIAARHGLTGHARNVDDGSVEVAVCGEQANVAEFFLDLQARQPPSGRVDGVEFVGRKETSFKPAFFKIC
ncbi:MAG: acylphosphatase [Candidatus Micrarchaeota archaeon]